MSTGPNAVAQPLAEFKWRGKMSHGLTDPIPGALHIANHQDEIVVG